MGGHLLETAGEKEKKERIWSFNSPPVLVIHRNGNGDYRVVTLWILLSQDAATLPVVLFCCVRWTVAIIQTWVDALVAFILSSSSSSSSFLPQTLFSSDSLCLTPLSFQLCNSLVRASIKKRRTKGVVVATNEEEVGGSIEAWRSMACIWREVPAIRAKTNAIKRKDAAKKKEERGDCVHQRKWERQNSPNETISFDSSGQQRELDAITRLNEPNELHTAWRHCTLGAQYTMDDETSGADWYCPCPNNKIVDCLNK